MQNYLCFQPQYFTRFICDATKCNDNCCEQQWIIAIDKTTYKKYLHLRPESAAHAITKHFTYDEKNDCYLLAERPCPFLTEKKLCHLQLEHGENFLSPTCRTYPRVICDFGNFFERSLDLSCPIAAEMIMLTREPMSFELVEKNFSADKFHVSKMHVAEKFSAHVVNIQAAMISILQERTLSINQRLIVLGFFLDRLDEMSADSFDEAALMKLIALYESKNFFVEQVPRMLASVHFDEKNFFDVMSMLAAQIPDEIISVAKLTTDYKQFGSLRKKILAEYATVIENFLVNEIFQSCCPWRFDGGIVNNFGLFLAKYKIFEMMLLSAAIKNFVDKGALIRLASYFTASITHVEEYQRRIFIGLANYDAFNLIESLLDGGD